jgi:hypothetical protein
VSVCRALTLMGCKRHFYGLVVNDINCCAEAKTKILRMWEFFSHAVLCGLLELGSIHFNLSLVLSDNIQDYHFFQISFGPRFFY